VCVTHFSSLSEKLVWLIITAVPGLVDAGATQGSRYTLKGPGLPIDSYRNIDTKMYTLGKTAQFLPVQKIHH
jgi:hypothetical protein